MKFLVTVLIFFMFSICNASNVVEQAQEYDEQFMFDSNNIGQGFSLLQTTNIFIENGKLCFPIYVD